MIWVFTTKRPNLWFPLWRGPPLSGNPATPNAIKHSTLSPGAIPSVATAIKELGFPAIAMEAFKCDH